MKTGAGERRETEREGLAGIGVAASGLYSCRGGGYGTGTGSYWLAIGCHTGTPPEEQQTGG